MEYPKEFVEKAKRLYPNWKRLHELLDKGSPFVNTLLREARPVNSISFAKVLNAKSLEELQEYAKLELERSELYLEWDTIYGNYRRSRNAERLREIEEAHQRGETLT
jgi:hypothetical protein